MDAITQQASITVSLRDFLRSGEFGPVRLGISRDELVGLLGWPQNWDAKESHARAGILLYGRIGFHFLDDQLWMIYADAFRTLYGGERLRIEPWILRGRLSLRWVLRQLDAAGIAYQQVRVPYRPDSITVVTASRVQLTFGMADEWPGLNTLSYDASWPSRAVPINYQPLGCVEHYWERAAAVAVRLDESTTLRPGQQVTFYQRDADQFITQPVESLRVDYAPVEQAAGGTLAIFPTALPRQQVRPGTPVYLVLES